MADEEVEPGWYPAGATPNEQLHWDGQRWTARRRWVHSAWVDVPMEDPGPTPSSQEHRWSTTTVVLLVVALAGLGAVIFAVVNSSNSAPTPKSTSATAGATTEPRATAPTSVAIQQASEAEVAACARGAEGRRRAGRLPGAEGRLPLAAGTAWSCRRVCGQLPPPHVRRRRRRPLPPHPTRHDPLHRGVRLVGSRVDGAAGGLRRLRPRTGFRRQPRRLLGGHRVATSPPNRCDSSDRPAWVESTRCGTSPRRRAA